VTIEGCGWRCGPRSTSALWRPKLPSPISLASAGDSSLALAEDANALAASINPESMQRPLVREYKRREVVRELLGGGIVLRSEPAETGRCVRVTGFRPVFNRAGVLAAPVVGPGPIATGSGCCHGGAPNRIMKNLTGPAGEGGAFFLPTAVLASGPPSSADAGSCTGPMHSA
jgi:hypothetical protein